MRWFGGADGPTHDRGLMPVGARSIWAGSRPLWTVGTWRADELRVVSRPQRRVAVFGVCRATDAELRRLLTEPKPADVAHRWAGSYTVVIQDDNATHAFTDLGWAWPIYTTRVGEQVIFSSSCLPLATLAGWEIDRDWLIPRLLQPNRPDLLYGRSPFKAVATTPPGSRLTVTTAGRYSVTPAWQPATPTALPDGARQLAGALRGGIALRTAAAETVTTDLSGGLDSSSVTLLAAHTQPIGSVHAITLHPSGVTGGGDLDAAKRVAAAEQRIHHHLLSLDETAAPYTRVPGLPITDEPAPSTTTFARFRTQLRLLQKLGSTCHLTGDGGDAVLTAPLDYLADLATPTATPTLLRHCAGWARLRNRSMLGLLVAASRARRRRGAGPHTREPAKSSFTANARTAAVELTHLTPLTTYAQLSAGDRTALAEITFIGRSDRADAQLTDALGITLHNPFLDSAVIDACLRVPAGARTSPFTAKPLLRLALNDAVPAFVFDRRTKGDFTADEYLGIRANLEPLRNMFTAPRLADLGIIAPLAVQDVISRAAGGLPFDLAAFDALVMVEAWLGVIASAPRPRWTQSHARAA